MSRGTTNSNSRGSTRDRLRRRQWIVETFRANHDVNKNGNAVECGDGEPACRCYRCGKLLTVNTVTIDRVRPGAHGGTYKRFNIRPACAFCNSSTGAQVRRVA